MKTAKKLLKSTQIKNDTLKIYYEKKEHPFVQTETTVKLKKKIAYIPKHITYLLICTATSNAQENNSKRCSTFGNCILHVQIRMYIHILICDKRAQHNIKRSRILNLIFFKKKNKT